jgi:hypothetical protein
MIPDIAVIVAAYAVARLLNEYVIVGEQVHQLRVFVSLIALAVIIIFLIGVVNASNSLNLNI